MTVLSRLRPALPVAIALAGVAITLAAASRLLPPRVVMVHLSETGGSAFAASRADLGLLGVVVVAGVLVVWLVAAAVLAVVPARHLLVPRADHWKQPAHRPEMRRRYASYLAVATAASLWFVAALYVVAMVSQDGGPLAAWWLPAAVSVAFVLFVLGGLVWVFTIGFAPPPGRAGESTQRQARSATTEARDTSRSAPVGPTRPTPPGAGSVGRGPEVPSPGPGAAPAPGSRGRSPGRTPPGDGARTGPPRPYQPRPRQGGPRG